MIQKLAIAASLLVAAGAAQAADMYSPSAKDAPVYVSASNWGGFYIGATVGAAGLKTKYAEPLEYTDTKMAPITGGGAIGGLTVGYNWQFGKVVLGVEGDWSAASVGDSSGDYYGSGRSTLSDFATIRGRLGYTFDRTLIYATGGAAFGDFKSCFGSYYAFTYPSEYCKSANGFVTGYTVGGGVEQALTEHLSMKLEALYSDFGTTHGADLEVDSSVNRTNFDNSLFVGRVGLNYKLSGGDYVPLK